tara:strand:- start:172 stop:633 length:462 start_codon:yes stop_codon:yes gene_type:complete
MADVKKESKKTLSGSFLLKMVYGASSSILMAVGMILYKLFPEFFIRYLVFLLFIAAIGLFSFLIPAESGFIRELKKIDPTNKDKKIKTAEILGEQIGSNIFFLIPGSSQVIATFLIAFVQNPAIALPVIMPLIGGIVLAFNNVVDFFSETFVK